MLLNSTLISVVIPHLNQPNELEACLCSLEVQSLSRELFEVLVIDNGSTQHPVDVVARHPGVRLFKELDAGPGPARNTGVRHATGNVLAFIDADCRAHPLWLETALRTLHSAREGTILGGDVKIWRENKTRFSAIEAYESVFAYRFKLYVERHGFAGTGNLVVYRADFETIGPFAGIQIAEDMEWGKRACAKGYHFVYVDDLIVFHPARRSLKELYAKWDRQIHHYVNMADGSLTWKFRWVLRATAVLASPFFDFIKVLNSDRVFGFWSRMKAISVLFAVRVHRARKMLSLLFTRHSIVWNPETEV